MSASSNSHQNIAFSSCSEARFKDTQAGDDIKHLIAQSANSGTLVDTYLGTSRNRASCFTKLEYRLDVTESK